MEISDMELEEIGQVADSIDNLLGALKLPLSDRLHLEGLRESLPDLARRLKSVVVTVSRNDPWSKGDGN